MNPNLRDRPRADLTGVPKQAAKEDRLAQATVMLQRRLFEHRTCQEIADEFGVSRETVSRRLQLARREGVPEEARTIFIREMLPAAMAVVLETLKDPDKHLRFKAAKMVVDGLNAMDGSEDEKEARKTGASEGDTYEVWREKIRVTKRAVDAAGARISGSDGAKGGGSEGAVIDITPEVSSADPEGDETAGRAEPAEVSLRESEPV